MAETLDLQAVDRGLGALSGLLENAEVRSVVAVFRADFGAASEQIEILSDYKDLHDLLHDLQFQCYNYIASQIVRFPHDELSVDTLADHALTFRGMVERLQEAAARPTVSGELGWIGELSEAEALLAQALDTRDPLLLKRHCRLVRRVLDRYPSLVNARLNSAARALRMDAIERAMTAILDMLTARVGQSAEVASFAAGTTALIELGRRLACLVRDHDRWQEVDVELRRVEATLAVDPEELALSWPEIKKLIEPMLCGENSRQPQSLGADSANLDAALQAGDPEQTRRAFLRFQRQTAEHFYRVDTDLKNLCGQLRTIGAPLAAVARVVAAMPGRLGPEGGVNLGIGAPAPREHLQTMLAELEKNYAALTDRIAALDRDIATEVDGERRLLLRQRRDERAGERDELVAIRSQYEVQLAAADGTRDQGAPSAQAGGGADEH